MALAGTHSSRSDSSQATSPPPSTGGFGGGIRKPPETARDPEPNPDDDRFQIFIRPRNGAELVPVSFSLSRFHFAQEQGEPIASCTAIAAEHPETLSDSAIETFLTKMVFRERELDSPYQNEFEADSVSQSLRQLLQAAKFPDGEHLTIVLDRGEPPEAYAVFEEIREALFHIASVQEAERRRQEGLSRLKPPPSSEVLSHRFMNEVVGAAGSEHGAFGALAGEAREVLHEQTAQYFERTFPKDPDGLKGKSEADFDRTVRIHLNLFLERAERAFQERNLPYFANSRERDLAVRAAVGSFFDGALRSLVSDDGPQR